MNNDQIIDQARQIDVRSLCADLLESASGEKFACPGCPSSDALAARDDHAVCYSAAHPGGSPHVYDGIALVQEAMGVGFVRAVEWMTGQTLDSDGSGGGGGGRGRSRPTSLSGRPTRDPSDDNGPVDVEPTTLLLEAMLERKLKLGKRGRSYLAGRGISATLAQSVGIVDCIHDHWGALVAEGCGGDWDLVRASGLAPTSGGDGRVHPYYRHFIAFPYWDVDGLFGPPDAAKEARTSDGVLETVRFRTTVPGERPKMMSLTREGPSSSASPYLAGAARLAGQATESPGGPPGLPLFVVEGELDALSVIEAGRPAVASYSASVWPESWCTDWLAYDVPRVVVVAEGDQGGEEFASRVWQAAVSTCGQAWADERVRVVRMDEGVDCNDLRQEGALCGRLDRVVEDVGAGGSMGV